MSAYDPPSVNIQPRPRRSLRCLPGLGNTPSSPHHDPPEFTFTVSERVRFARKRFGLYEVIDFLAVLIGYALSGEPTLAAFASASPFATEFIALFGRREFPRHSSLSRFCRPWMKPA